MTTCRDMPSWSILWHRSKQLVGKVPAYYYHSGTESVVERSERHVEQRNLAQQRYSVK